MCGIIGYVGDRNAQPILVEGLKRLEYRGYDSAGIAMLKNGGLDVVRATGRISALEPKLDWTDESGRVGIAHTRWATHGAPNEANAHPHVDASGKIALIHNGIIENFETLRKYIER